MIIKKNTDVSKEKDKLYPDFFKSTAEKEKETFIKGTMDFYAERALIAVKDNIQTFGRNYKFYKGILDKQDFYEFQESDGFAKGFVKDLGYGDDEDSLPDYVRLYSLLAQPINTLVGERIDMQDISFVKAFDDDSINEELDYKTGILQDLGGQAFYRALKANLAKQDVDLKDPEIDAQIAEEVQERVMQEISNYSTVAEKWANKKLEDAKVYLNYEEIDSDSFTDLIKVGRSRLHVYRNNTKTGYGAENLNPVLCDIHKTPGVKYTADAHGVTIAGLMDLSEILERFDLSIEEIDHLREQQEEGHHDSVRYGQLSTKKTGQDSIKYVTEKSYVSPLIGEAQSLPIHGGHNMDDIATFLGRKKYQDELYLVIQTYIRGKEKVGELTYIDEEGDEVTIIVSDDYKKGEHPGELELTWGYFNRWYRGLRIGDEIYQLNPLEIVDRLPVVGIDQDDKNAEIKSFMDAMKDFQVIYSLAINQLWELLQKEIGVVHEFNWRKIPVNKDSNYEDALDEWLTQARELGFIFNDDSPENMKATTSNTNVSRAINLARTEEFESRIRLAQMIKDECHQMVGTNRQRLGDINSSETATGTQAARSASYAQTRPLFLSQEIVMNQFQQLLIDIIKNTEVQNEASTLRITNSEGETAFLEITREDIEFKDLRMFVTSRDKDIQQINHLKELSLSMLQNGADPYVVAKTSTSNSIKVIMEEFRKDKEERMAQLEAEREDMQKQQEHEQEMIDKQIQEAAQKDQNDKAFSARESQLDRISQERIATIRRAKGEGELVDADDSGIADVLEQTKMDAEIDQAAHQYEMEMNRANSESVRQQNEIHNNKEEAIQTAMEKQKELELKRREVAVKENKNVLESKKLDQQLEVAKYYDKGKKGE